MPRGDGSGPMGNGPLGRGRGGCQRMAAGNQFGIGFGRSRQGGLYTATPKSLEEQAQHLEAQAATLRSRAAQRHKAE